jgi:DNA polymerase family A
VRDAAGDWVFSMAHFEAYLNRHKIDWPRLDSGKLNMQRKVFDDLAKAWPQLEQLRQLRHARNKMRRVKLAVGADGRNRTVLWPFKAKTSRTQPKAAQWIFSPAVWLRSLIKPAPGMAVAYVDYSSMEFLIAGAMSEDSNMLEMYRSGDPYLNFAKAVGTIPSWGSKTTHGEVRDKYKAMLLSSQYGVGAATLAARLGISTFEAHELINQHHEQFARYWLWSDDWLHHVLQSGVMRTVFGWTYRTGAGDINARSLRNWPVQAMAADILRIAVILATRHGIRLLARSMTPC